MKFPTTRNRKKPVVLFYSGFLTGDGTHGTTPSKNKADAWHNAVTGFFGTHASVHRATWPAAELTLETFTGSDSVWGSLGRIGRITLTTIEAWSKAAANADREAERLANRVDTHDHPTILVGHSLGGRIVLKAAQMAKSAPDVVAFAPALCVDDINMEELYSPHRTVEIYRSENDRVLRYMYPAGQFKIGQVVGLEGIPSKPHFHRGVHCFDAKKFVGSAQEIGHTDYVENLDRFRSVSPLLRELEGTPFDRSIHRWR